VLVLIVFLVSLCAHGAVLFAVSRLVDHTPPAREPQVVRVTDIPAVPPPPVVEEKKPEPPKATPVPVPVKKKERPPRVRNDERVKPQENAPPPEVRAGLSDSAALPGSGSSSAPAAAQGNSAEVAVDPEAARRPPPPPAPGTPEPVDPDANPVTEASADEPASCPSVREIQLTDDAINAGLTSGRFVVEGFVSASGALRDVKLREGTGYAIDQVVVQEIRKLNCRPAKKGGKDVAQRRVRIEMTIEL